MYLLIFKDIKPSSKSKWSGIYSSPLFFQIKLFIHPQDGLS